MSTQAHTPGPLEARCVQTNSRRPFAVIDPNAPHGDGIVAGFLSEADAHLYAAAPDLNAAAALAITALAFAQETYQRAGDAVALAQTTAAKNALIAAQDKARGREPQMRDVTPKRAAVARAEGRS